MCWGLTESLLQQSYFIRNKQNIRNNRKILGFGKSSGQMLDPFGLSTKLLFATSQGFQSVTAPLLAVPTSLKYLPNTPFV
jgi:hypothetical protein